MGKRLEMNQNEKIISKVFEQQQSNGCWKMLDVGHKYYPVYQHYVPNFKATLWTLILLADLELDPTDERVKRPLETIKIHFFDSKQGIYSLGNDHFPIPCLNGNLIYLDAYFNPSLSEQSLSAINFFSKNQRFDDGIYIEPKNVYCKNTSCYGKHTCYWGVVKLLKGLSFVPEKDRTPEAKSLIERCINFVLLHRVCFSSRNPEKPLSNNIEKLGFPCMYKSNYLEILWLLKREGVHSRNVDEALKLLQSKQQPDGIWLLEKQVANMVASVGSENRPNPFITHRANEILSFFYNSAST